MAVEDDEMRLEFLQDFGSSSCTFTDTSAGSTATISAILSKAYFAEDVGGTMVESSEPIAMVRTTDVPNVVQGDTLAIDSVTYYVVEVNPDNEGMSELRLRV